VSDEEVVVIQQDGQANVLAKMLDLSDTGTLTYLLEEGDASGSAVLSIFHQGKVFEVPATVARKNGRLIAFNFVSPSPEATHEIQSKLIRMEVEWMRLSGRG
jgi:hypothetical protein